MFANIFLISVRIVISIILVVTLSYILLPRTKFIKRGGGFRRESFKPFDTEELD